MDKELELSIFTTIKETADKLSESGITFTRADIASELKQFGIDGDSSIVSNLVNGAFQYYKNDPAIKKAFKENTGGLSLIESCVVEQLILDNNIDGAITQLSSIGNELKATLVELQTLINTPSEKQESKVKLLDYVVGQAGVVKVQQEATRLYEVYSKLVFSYKKSEQDIKNLIYDFSILRGELIKVYHTYTNILIDIFGDSIKKTAPEIFDFESIEFMNIENMMKEVELQYTNLSNSCSLLMSMVSDSFKSTMLEVVESLGDGGASQYLGLAKATSTIANHYMSASSRAEELKIELQEFQKKQNIDSTNIKADLGRLELIYKTINDLHIPRASVFFKHAHKVMSGDIKQISNVVYSSSELKELITRRNAIFGEMQTVYNTILDCQRNIEYYTASTTTYRKQIEDSRVAYQDAVNSFPAKPSRMQKLFSFGSANKRYASNVHMWDKANRPLIDAFENIQTDLLLDEHELNSQQELLNKSNSIYKRLKSDADLVSSLIYDKMSDKTIDKAKLGKHLNSIVALAFQAKEIISSGISEDLQKVNQLNIDNAYALPVELQSKLESYIGKAQDLSCQESSESHNTTSAQNNNKQLANESFEIAKKMIALKIAKANNSIEAEKYNQEMQKMLDHYKSQTTELDAEAAKLNEILAKINTADDTETLREGLLELTGKNNDELSDDEIKDFLNGNKTIEI